MINNAFICFLVISGLVFWIVTLIVDCGLILGFFKDNYKRILYKWKVKHRFKKKPIAKCFCIDCFYYKDHCEINKTGRCLRLERIVADDGFCKDAFPYRKDDCK